MLNSRGSCLDIVGGCVPLLQRRCGGWAGNPSTCKLCCYVSQMNTVGKGHCPSSFPWPRDIICSDFISCVKHCGEGGKLLQNGKTGEWQPLVSCLRQKFNSSSYLFYYCLFLGWGMHTSWVKIYFSFAVCVPVTLNQEVNKCPCLCGVAFSFLPHSVIPANVTTSFSGYRLKKTPKFEALKHNWTRKKFIWFLTFGENTSFLRRNNLMPLGFSAISLIGALPLIGDKIACSGL